MPLTNSSYLANGVCILSKASIFHGHLAKGTELAHVLRCLMDRQTPGVSLGQHIPCLSLLQPCCRREGHGVEGTLSQVWMLGALPAAAAAALRVLTSLDAALPPPPRWLQAAGSPRVAERSYSGSQSRWCAGRFAWRNKQ